MKRVFRYLSTRKIFGLFNEYLMTVVWVLKLRLTLRYRLLYSQVQQKSISSDVEVAEVFLSCRNFLMPGFSGVNVWIENIARALSSSHKITIFCQGRELLTKKTIIKDGITIVTLPVLRYLYFLKLPLYSAWNAALAQEAKEIPSGRSIILPISGVESFGLIENEGLNVFTLLVTDERTHRYPTLSRLAAKDLKNYDPRTRNIILRERRILENSNGRFLADSHAIIRHLEYLYDLELECKSTILPINISKDYCAPVAKEKVIFFIGRSDSRKGLGTLLDSWELINRFTFEWKLVVATSGGDDFQSFERAQDLSNRMANFELIVNASEEVKHHVMNVSSIVVYPSTFESFGIVATEAMQHGCVVLASDIESFREVLDDCGVFFKSSSSLDLAVKLICLTRNETLRAALSKLAITRSNTHFSDEQVEKILRELI